jgi:hypothetical protein
VQVHPGLDVFNGGGANRFRSDPNKMDLVGDRMYWFCGEMAQPIFKEAAYEEFLLFIRGRKILFFVAQARSAHEGVEGIDVQRVPS